MPGRSVRPPARGNTPRIQRPRSCAWRTRSTTSRRNCGCRATRCRRNSSKPPTIRTGLWLRTTTAFERAIAQHVLGPRLGFPAIPLDPPALFDGDGAGDGAAGQVGCRRARARTAAPEGCRRPPADADDGEAAQGARDPNQVVWFDDPDRLGRLYEYCRQDVETERELFTRLQPLSPSEQALWVLDATINQRGFCIDRDLAEAARKIAHAAGAGDRCRARRSHRRRCHRRQSSSPGCKRGYSRTAAPLKTYSGKRWRHRSRSPKALVSVNEMRRDAATLGVGGRRWDAEVRALETILSRISKTGAG